MALSNGTADAHGSILSPSIELSLTEVLTSLSFALDLTSGQAMGHAQRTCLIGMRIASEMGLSEEDSASLYYALLLKDSGCSSNAARMAEIFGCDDIDAKRLAAVTDWSNVFSAAKYAMQITLPKKSLLSRARRLLQLSTTVESTRHELMSSRCSRGAQIARNVGLGDAAARCINELDEHWDGSGAPNGVKGTNISLLARIASVAQTLEVFENTFDLALAYDMLLKRAGKWFDPDVVNASRSFMRDAKFWIAEKHGARDALIELDVRPAVELAGEERLDAVCVAFAQIVDAKSPFTAEHSSRVSAYAVAAGVQLGIEGPRIATLRRAALLHDVGKLAVSNSILDKAGKLDADEWISIRKHPYYTSEILKPIKGFERIEQIASAHHERLDGKGYFRNLTGDDLDLDMRLLAVADVFDALSAERPYRDALELNEVFAILDKESGVGLDAQCIEAMKAVYLRGNMSLNRPVSVLKAA